MENEKYILVQDLVSIENIELYRKKLIREKMIEAEKLMEHGLLEDAENFFRRAARYEEYSQKFIAELLLTDAVSDFLYDEKVALKYEN